VFAAPPPASRSRRFYGWLQTAFAPA